jgi:16S rRNA (guanine527-N7)-methyltransferase
LPLAIVREDIEILGLDSTAKRTNYVNESAALLGLKNLTAICARAEDAARLSDYRETFDFATARAVAELRTLTELCLPFVKIGGKMLAMKGKNAEFELKGAKKAISMLGGADPVCHEIKLIGEGEDFSHPVIEIKKRMKTPALYPRPYAKISKSPL